MPNSIQIVSVNVSLPRVIGVKAGEDVWSSIQKDPVEGTDILLTWTALCGDQQADTRPKKDNRQLHGGNEMAVYAYPSEHWPLWAEELDEDFGPGDFGENLSISGALEKDVQIGDLWYWGEKAVLEVSKPREPCASLQMHLGVDDIIRRMKENGRCGWYLRVLKPGVVPTSGEIRVEKPRRPTIATVFRGKSRGRSG